MLLKRREERVLLRRGVFLSKPLSCESRVCLRAGVAGLPLERHSALLERGPLGEAGLVGRVLRHAQRTLVSDALRLAVLFVEGGVYADTDVVFLRDVRSLPSFVACEEGPAALPDLTCEAPCQAVLSFSARHPRLGELLADVARRLDGESSPLTRLEDLRSYEASKALVAPLDEDGAGAAKSFLRALLSPWGFLGPQSLASVLKLWREARLSGLAAEDAPLQERRQSVEFPNDSCVFPSLSAEPSSALTLYGASAFFPLHWNKRAENGLHVAAPELWETRLRREGESLWRSRTRDGHVFSLHLYASALHSALGDFQTAATEAREAAFGVLMRSYCLVLCGHLRLGLFAGREANRLLTLEDLFTLKAWLRQRLAL